MTTRVLNRPARAVRPVAALPDLLLAAPPVLPDSKTSGGSVQALLPIVGAMSSMTMMITLRRSAIMVGVGILVMVAAAVGGLAMMLGQRGQATRTRRLHRERYLDYLEERREELGTAQLADRAAATMVDPDPRLLPELVADPARIWERRRGDADFLRVRLGLGQTPWRRIVVPDDSTPVAPADPFMLAEARALASRYESAPLMPVGIPLDSVGEIVIVGAREDALRVIRAIGAQLISLHAPDDVALAVACSATHAADWGWLPWTPHSASGLPDGPVFATRTAPTLAALAELLSDDLTMRARLAAEARRSLAQLNPSSLAQRLVIFSDNSVAGRLPLPDATLNLSAAGITLVHIVPDRLAEPGDIQMRVTIQHNGTLLIEDLRDPKHLRSVSGLVDQVSALAIDSLARQVAPLRLSAASLAEQSQLGVVDVATLLGLDGAQIDLDTAWSPRAERDFLRVPIGVDDSGVPVLLDLKESAQLGMGPHGLCVGATGSGKSELMRSVIAALAMTHPPEDIAMVLVDYKGGAAFAPLAHLPHVTGLITNLADEPGLIERAHASLAGEVVRRQHALKEAGDLADIGQYRMLRATSQPGLRPMPHLLVVIDEFAELLNAQEDFIELFMTIGRIGRSIGVHLLLASQRIEAGKLRGLDTYLSYRLGLRTFSESESVVVLDTPDAYHLPPLPGFGWLKVDTSVYTRFRAAYVSGPHAIESRDTDDAAIPPAPLRLPFYPGVWSANNVRPAGEFTSSRRTLDVTLLDVVVPPLRSGHPDSVPAIWLPPLPPLLTLDHLYGKPSQIDERGIRFNFDYEAMRIPAGLLDDPKAQRQQPWLLDLTTSGGHVAIVGGPQSGKSTLLRTIAMSLALTHTPKQVAIYGIDFTGGGLSALRDLPHVGGIASRTDSDRLRRTLEELRAMLDHREVVFRDRQLDSMEHLRDRHAAGAVAELPAADIVLLIDGAGALRSEFEDLDPAVTDLITRGPGYGIHVVVSVARWNEIRIAMQPAFGTRIELRLNDPADSMLSRKLAAGLRANQPGRALTGHFIAQVALPRVDGVSSIVGLSEAIRLQSSSIDAAWSGGRAPAVRVLPTEVQPGMLPDAIDEPDLVPIGINEATLDAVGIDLLGRDQHLIVLGDSAAGKTSLLRGLARGMIARRTNDELVVAVIDLRLGLSDLVPPEYLGGYAHTAERAERLAASIAKELSNRVPDLDNLSAHTPRYAGPRIVVLVDDYDLLTAGGRQPLEPLLAHLPGARDVGLHLVISRPVAGAGRGLWDPALQLIRDTGAVGLVMSGDRSEGQLFPGVYARSQPAGRGVLVRRGQPSALVQTAYHQAGP